MSPRCLVARSEMRIVFIQMTKVLDFPLGTGGDDIADFNMAIGNDDAVDQQFDKLATLSEGQGFQSRLDTLTEILDANCERCQISLFLSSP